MLMKESRSELPWRFVLPVHAHGHLDAQRRDGAVPLLDPAAEASRDGAEQEIVDGHALADAVRSLVNHVQRLVDECDVASPSDLRVQGRGAVAGPQLAAYDRRRAPELRQARATSRLQRCHDRCGRPRRAPARGRRRGRDQRALRGGGSDGGGGGGSSSASASCSSSAEPIAIVAWPSAIAWWIRQMSAVRSPRAAPRCRSPRAGGRAEAAPPSAAPRCRAGAHRRPALPLVPPGRAAPGRSRDRPPTPARRDGTERARFSAGSGARGRSVERSCRAGTRPCRRFVRRSRPCTCARRWRRIRAQGFVSLRVRGVRASSVHRSRVLSSCRAAVRQKVPGHRRFP